ncbi:MAG TPA: hypothetical protein VHO24_12265 [Opitutaceae bacterium]|nr:hypothetical protein [Opitutaceae bacterium]
MKKAFFAMAGMAIAAVAAMAWLNFKSAQEARALVAGLTAKHARLNAEIKATGEKLAAAASDREALEKQRSEALSLQGKGAVGATVSRRIATPPTPPPPVGEVLKLMDADPALRRLFKQSVHAGLGFQLLPFYEKARLTSDQRVKFEELMIQEAEDRMVLAALMQEQKVPATDPTVVTMRRDMEEKLNAAQQEVLGDEGYEQLQQFKRLEPITAMANGVVSMAGHTSEPMTGPQTLRLLNLMANASGRYQAGGKADLMTMDWPRVQAEAREFLSPVQLAALKANGNMVQLAPLAKQYFEQQAAASGK